MSCHQTAGQNQNREVANKSTCDRVQISRNVVMCQSFVHKEIKGGLNLGNVCCSESVILSPTGSVKIKIYLQYYLLFCMSLRLGLLH
jgi:hypothetical protein